MNPVYLEALVVALGILLLMAEAFLPSGRKNWIAYAGVAGLLGIFALTFQADAGLLDPSAGYASLYVADSLAIFFKQFALLVTAFILLLAVEYSPVLEKYIPGTKAGAGTGEYYALAVFVCAGLMWMVSAIDFILIFVALELVTITFYILVAYMRRSNTSLEAGVKYLILGALSTGFIVYGITWIFGATGTTNLQEIANTLPALPETSHPALLFGLALVLVSLGFKVAAVPFQFWIPDVYQGAPTPTMAFLSVGSKAAGFVVLLRVLEPFFAVPALSHKLLQVLVILAAATMILGNLAALPQTNFKRLLAYSSIAHAGYLLMGVASIGSLLAGPAIGFYLTAYALMTLLSLAVLIIVARMIGGDNISDFNGLGRRSPFLAALMTISVLALAGLPFTAGFFGKFFIFLAAAQQGLTLLVIIGIVAVGCGFYYYLKIVRAMYWMSPKDIETNEIHVSPLLSLTLLVLVAAIIVLGINPSPILSIFY
ncbi:MAG: NADH-quinone oxidoreductase subunit N [Chthoniobacterales bacterium]